MISDDDKIATLTRLGIELNQTQNLNELLEHILYHARRFVNAEAGSIYLRNQGRLSFAFTQNDSIESGEKILVYSNFTIPVNEFSIAGYVAQSGETLRIPDAYNISEELPYQFNKEFDLCAGYETKSVLAVPLLSAEEENLGVLQLINARNLQDKVGNFDDSSEMLMLHFASIAAVALQRAEMTRQLQQCKGPISINEKLEAITDLGIELSQVHDLDILLERILFEARRFVNCEAGSIYIRDNDQLNFTYTQNEVLQARLQANEKLIYADYHLPINEKSIAGYVAETGKIVNIPDAYQIDEEQPYRFSDKFDKAADYVTKSVLAVPLTTPDQSNLGVLQLINVRDNFSNILSFSKMDEQMMLHFGSVAAVAIHRAKITRALLLRVITMAEMRDPKETGAHVNRVACYSMELYELWAVRRDFPDHEIARNREILRMAAMLHDVGKIAIPDRVLKKPGKLTAEEYEEMKEHARLGAKLFGDQHSNLDKAAAEVALSHHEKWDGSGYPGFINVDNGEPLAGYQNEDGGARGKKGEEIPIFGRIVALADVYDALSFARVYKKAWEEKDVLETIEKSSGSHFDPELVQLLFDNLDLMRSIQQRYKD